MKIQAKLIVEGANGPPGDPFNDIDLILNSIPDPKGRARMIARQLPMDAMPVPNIIGYEHDIVLRGSRHTPFGI